MLIAIASQNPMLVRSISLMLSDPELDMSAASIFSSEGVTPGAAQPDLLLYDADLPKQWHRQALQAGRKLPVVIIANPDAAERVLPGLEDAELLVTPLTQRDLISRVTAALATHSSRIARKLRVGALELDLGKRSATVDGVPLPLTNREFDVLEYLALRKGVTLTKEMFLERLYGGIDEPEIKIVDVFVCKIRRKIREITGSDTLIDTVWGRGYVLHDPAERDMPQSARQASG